MTLYKWSQTPSSDAAADPTINWAEGQAPSSINDSARAMMAATAKYRDDIAGAIVTSGSSTAYAVSSYEVFDTLAHLNGQMIAFTPHVTNGAGSPSVTLNVDSLGAKPLRTAPNVDLSSGTLIQGTPYAATYNNADGAFYLQGFYGNPYNIPIGAGFDFWAPTAPNSSFVFPFGQAVSRTIYATYFAMIGTTFGGGDGSTTFNLPDKRGRVSAAADNLGGSSASRLTASSVTGGMTGGTIGGVGGEQIHTLTVAEMPAHNHGVTDPGHTHTWNPTSIRQFSVGGTGGALNTVQIGNGSDGTFSNTAATTGISIQSNGNGNSHNVVQPTIVCNYIMRII